MLELWKPLKTLNDRNNPVIFNELGQGYFGDKSLRPFIIFYDDKEDCYYYIKARTLKQFSKIQKGEIIIKQTISSEGLFTNDSLVDCSQIFKCERQLLESLIDTNDKLYKSTFILPDNDIKRILESINENIMEIPPYLSIVEVKLDNKDNTYGESLYLCDEKYLDVEQKIYDDIYNGDDIHDLTDLKSNINDKYSFQRNRYNTGINFCKMFLNEYFPNEIEEFIKIQDLQKSKSNEREL